MSGWARLQPAALLACAALLLLTPQLGQSQGLLLGSQLGSTPSLGRLLDPGPATPVSNTAAGTDDSDGKLSPHSAFVGCHSRRGGP